MSKCGFQFLIRVGAEKSSSVKPPVLASWPTTLVSKKQFACYKMGLKPTTRRQSPSRRPTSTTWSKWAFDPVRNLGHNATSDVAFFLFWWLERARAQEFACCRSSSSKAAPVTTNRRFDSFFFHTTYVYYLARVFSNLEKLPLVVCASVWEIWVLITMAHIHFLLPL